MEHIGPDQVALTTPGDSDPDLCEQSQNLDLVAFLGDATTTPSYLELEFPTEPRCPSCLSIIKCITQCLGKISSVGKRLEIVICFSENSL